MPPISWTSKGTISQPIGIPTTGQDLPQSRRQASLTAANASGNKSSSVSPSSSRFLNSAVLFANCVSDKSLRVG
jgi:hypothetical protein